MKLHPTIHRDHRTCPNSGACSPIDLLMIEVLQLQPFTNSRKCSSIRIRFYKNYKFYHYDFYRSRTRKGQKFFKKLNSCQIQTHLNQNSETCRTPKTFIYKHNTHTHIEWNEKFRQGDEKNISHKNSVDENKHSSTSKLLTKKILPSWGSVTEETPQVHVDNNR